MRSLADKLYTGVVHTGESIYNVLLSNCYKTVIKAQLSHRLKMLARWVYAGRIQENTGLTLCRQNDRLSLSRRKQIEKKRNRLLFILSAVIAVQGANPAQAAKYSVNQLKLYSHSRILDWKEFQCFNKIITKESRWSHSARNGSHYGLGQMRSTWYRDLDPYRQIDATLRYITKRYQTPCKAWAFHQERNYF